MLLDTSKARITVPAARGTATVACGRATAEQQEDQRGQEQQRRQVPAQAGPARAGGGQPGGRERVRAAGAAASGRPATRPSADRDGDREHHGILEAHARLPLRPADHVDQGLDQVLVGADPVRRSPRPAASTRPRRARGRPPRPATAAGTADRWCRRATARRSRRPRPGPARGRAGRAPSGRRRGSRPPRAGGSAGSAPAPSRRRR